MNANLPNDVQFDIAGFTVRIFLDEPGTWTLMVGVIMLEGHASKAAAFRRLSEVLYG